MSTINSRELYELYIDTLNKISYDLLGASEEKIETDIFEDFDIGVMSFFHDDNLNILENNDYISADIMELSQKLRQYVIKMQNTDSEWSINSFKQFVAWTKLFNISNQIKINIKEQ